MRVFVAAMVAVLGIGMFAVAALVWDRRRQLAGVLGAVGSRGAQQSGQPGSRRYLPSIAVLSLLLLGMIMLIGSCAGLLNF